MISRIKENLDIPESCVLNSQIFKKDFYENASLKKKGKDLFIKQIEKITLLFNFSESSINLKPYVDEDKEYEEILVILVKVKDESKTLSIAEVIQQSIPYPVVLVFQNGNKVKLNLARKRTNKSDETKNTVEQSITSDWIDTKRLSTIEVEFIRSLNIKNLRFSNAYELYSDVFFRVMLLNLSNQTNLFEVYLERDKNVIEEKYLLLAELDKNIQTLRTEIKKEQQINRQVDLNIRIKKLLEKKKSIISDII
ncbi:MAG: DUF4391 domain-containing protein [Tenericutes bacterium]|nr:DUF4391 domain-containing protein [Mycoplasmatota bacterium]